MTSSLPRPVATASIALIAMLGAFFISIAPTGAAQQSRVVFGPEVFARTGNGPVSVWTRAFNVPPNVSAPFTLTVLVGSAKDASLTLNGLEVVGKTDFKKTAQITKTVALSQSNTLEISLSGQAGTAITVSINGVINLGDLTQARTGHTATLMADGSVLIAGGDGPAGVGMSAERFSAVNLTFSPEADQLMIPRGQHTASVLADLSHLITGGQGTGGAAERFVPGSAQFSSIADSLRHVRFGHTATSLMDGSVLILGGRELITDGPIERFDPQPTVLFKPPHDPAAGTFMLLPQNLALARWDHTATLLPDGRIWILGGRNDFGFLASAEFYNPATNQSSPSEPLPEARGGHTATLLPNGKVLVLGGRNSGGYLSSALVFDPATGAVTNVASLSRARTNHTATLLNRGEILVTGGDAGAGPLASTELYGPPTPETTAPSVVQSFPATGATGVDLNQAIAVRFSEPIDVTTLTSGSVTLQINPVVAATISPSENGLLLYVLPTQKLQAGGHYTLTLSSAIKDTAGNPLAPAVIEFTAVEAPAITTVTPDSGPVGTSVTILGQHFDPSSPGLNVVKFDGIQAAVSAASATQIETSVPPGVATGTVDVSVTTRGGTATSSFATEYAVPRVDSISPTSAPAGSGDTTVSIFGANFVPASQVTFGGTPVLITLQTSGRLGVLVPAALLASPGTRGVVVTNPAPGGGTSNIATFTITGLLIADIAPSSGPVGSSVFITGVGFDPVAANNDVKFNGVTAVVIDASDTSIETTVPALATSGPITVTTSQGTALSAAFTVTTGTHILISKSPDKSTYGRGEPVTINTTVVDGVGNPVPNITVQLTSDPVQDARVGNTFTYNADGSYIITATAITGGGTTIEAAEQVKVEGQGPLLSCAFPQDGAMLNVAPGSSVTFQGSANLANGLTSLTVNGDAVSVDALGQFSTSITTVWGTNFVNLVMVDGEDHTSSRTCAFLVSDVWAQQGVIRNDTVSLKGTQLAIDDVNRGDGLDSVADILLNVLNSSALINTINSQLLAANPLKPSSCDQTVLGLCVLKSQVTYLSTQVLGPNTVNLTLVNGGIQAHARIDNAKLRLNTSGHISGIPFNTTGFVNFDFIDVDVIFDTGLSGGRPRASVRPGSATATVGAITTDFSGIDGFIVDLISSLAQGALRDMVRDVIRNFVTNNVNSVLDAILSSMDIRSLGTSYNVPRLDGSTLAVGFGVNFSSVSATSSRLLIGMGTKFTGPTMQSRPTLGAPIEPGAVLLDPTITSPITLGVSVHLGVFNQALHALWKGSYFDVVLAEGALNGLIPTGATLKTTALLTPVVKFAAANRLEISLGAMNMRLDGAPQFGQPVEATVGGRVSCRVTLLNGDMKLDQCTVDELHVSTDAELDAEGTTDLATFASDVLNAMLAQAGNDVLPALPIPTFPIPVSLVQYGLPANGVLGLTNPTLILQGRHVLLRGGFGIQ